ncbi:MAG: DHA2 family efflux MFS transporter permease subunit [Streptococcaceae bacterium]|jgi:EmrB/QacA subfamily drug resistance transporter|nr:DHA2 family efflux MFS transporter permease subunit [Streptococcaceae bacterium]
MTNAKRIQALIAIGISVFMGTLDGSIVNVALPTMARELHVSLAQITWVVTVYLIMISAIVLMFGRLGDLLGKARIFKIGAIIFSVGSLLAGLDFGFGLYYLLIARVIQAVGASMFMATSFGLVSEIFPIESRARALSINSMFVSVGSIAGPALGGLILQVTSWNWIFFINVPIGLFSYFLAQAVLPKTKGQGSTKDLDNQGSLFMFLAIVGLFLALNYGTDAGWTSPIVIVAALVGLVFLVLFIRTENRKEKPLIDLAIFKTRLFSMSVLTATLNFTAAMFVSILFPFYLQDYRGMGPGIAGIIMMAYPVAMLISSPIAGILADRHNKEWITFIGISGIILAQVGYLLIDSGSPIWAVIVALALHGASVGFFQSPNNALVMSTVERKYLGVAGSVNSLARNIAFVLGTSLATITLFFAMSRIAGTTIKTYVASQPSLFLQGMHIAFFLALAITVVTWILGLVRLVGKQKVV